MNHAQSDEVGALHVCFGLGIGEAGEMSEADRCVMWTKDAFLVCEDCGSSYVFAHETPLLLLIGVVRQFLKEHLKCKESYQENE